MSGDGAGVVSPVCPNLTRWQDSPQILLAGLPDFLHGLSIDGRFVFASPSCKTIIGYEPDALLGRFILEFVHPHDKTVFKRELHDAVAFGCRIRFHYRFRKADGEWVVLETQGHLYTRSEPTLPLDDNYHPKLVMMASPYNSDTTAMLDSFLDAKFREIKLIARLAKLKHEEQKYLGVEADRHQPSDKRTNRLPSSLSQSQTPSQIQDHHSESKSERTTTPATSIRCRPNERIGDLGIPIANPKSKTTHAEQKRRRTKAEAATERMCIHCNATVSPEWRTGPTGPKTLCNACGRKSILFCHRKNEYLPMIVCWAKREKRRKLL